MNVPEFIKNPIFWLVIVLIITIIIYFVMSKATPNTRTTCTSEQVLINGQCVRKCDPDKEIRCGTDCYSKFDYDCVQNNTVPCPKTKHCAGTDTCCPGNQHCVDGKCQECAIPCGAGCCTIAGQTCWNEQCCDPSRQGYDSSGKNKKCCDTELCGDNKICCDSNAGEICSEGRCVIGCPNTSKMDQYKCGDTIPTFTGTPTVCDADQICVHDCDKNIYSCTTNPCMWQGAPKQIPVLEKGGNQFLYNDKPVMQCQDVNGNKYIKSVDGLQPSIVSIKGTNTPQCTIDDCVKKISSQDINIINYNFDPTNTTLKDGTCTGVISCDKALLSDADVKNVCDTLGDNRCCKNSNKTAYTGQVCPEGQKCFNVNDVNVCAEQNPICLPNGTKFGIRTVSVQNGNIQGDPSTKGYRLAYKYHDKDNNVEKNPHPNDIWIPVDADYKTDFDNISQNCCDNNYFTQVEYSRNETGGYLNMYNVCGTPQKATCTNDSCKTSGFKSGGPLPPQNLAFQYCLQSNTPNTPDLCTNPNSSGDDGIIIL